LDGPSKNTARHETILSTAPLNAPESCLLTDTWVHNDSEYDLRCLLVLMDSKDPCYRNHGSPSTRRLDLLETSEVFDGGSKFVPTHNFRDFGLLWSTENLPFVSFGKWSHKEDAILWAWTYLWHAEMQRDSDDEEDFYSPSLATRRNYDRNDVRLEAIDRLTAKIGNRASRPSENSDDYSYYAMYEAVSIVEPVWNCHSYVDSPLNKKPADWQEEIRAQLICCDNCKGSNRLGCCRRCGVTLYCSKDCQEAKFSQHRKICQKLKLIAHHGKGAATLSVDDFVVEDRSDRSS